MKKILLSLFTVFSLFFSIFAVNSVEIKASDDEIIPYATVNTVNVNKTFKYNLQKAGCNGSVTFRVKGSYDITHNGSSYTVTDASLDVTIDSLTAEWDLEITDVTYVLNKDSVTVKISYKFLQPYFDCPIGGGYSYTMQTVTV